MAKVATDIEGYFASLSGINKNILAIHKNLAYSYGDKWSEFSVEEQEELLDQYHMNRSSINCKDNEEEVPDVFPRMKINCGEKIIVDFDNDDGWTWRDEHSGPFSWMSRSQQDLTLPEADSTDGAEEPPAKPVRPQRRHKSPDPSAVDNAANKGGVWNSPFLAHNAPQQEMSAADEIFLKFGIQFGGDKDKDDEENSPVHSAPMSPAHESSKLLPQSSDSVTPPASPRSVSIERDVETNSVSQLEITDTFRETAKYNESADTSSIYDNDTSEVQDAHSLVISNDGTNFKEAQVSPVYLEEPGESTTDSGIMATTADASNASTVADDSLLESFALPSVLGEPENDNGVKTGFDFLDNW